MLESANIPADLHIGSCDQGGAILDIHKWFNVKWAKKVQNADIFSFKRREMHGLFLMDVCVLKTGSISSWLILLLNRACCL